MRILFIIALLSLNALAKTSEDVVKEYLSYIENPKEEKIEKLFSKNYIKSVGGKEKLQTLFKSVKKKKRETAIKKVGSADDTDFIEITSGAHKTTFILKKENGQYKIDGNIKSE